MHATREGGVSLINRVKPKHLDLVLRIAETEQLQLAAQAMAMSQPAASRILADLEAAFGAALFTRHPLGMTPTPAGEVLIRHARVVVTALETMGNDLSDLRSGTSGSVRIGTVTGPAVACLMPAIKAVLADSPELHVSVDVAPSTALFRHLEEARYDFVLGRTTPGHQTRDFRLHPGRAEVVSLMVHTTHPLAGQADVDLSALAPYPWVIQAEGNPIREAVEGAFHSAGVAVPRVVLNSSSLLVALDFVADGRAIAPQTQEVQSLLAAAHIGANVTALATRTPIVVAPYFVIQDGRRALSHAAQRVLDEVLSRL